MLYSRIIVYLLGVNSVLHYEDAISFMAPDLKSWEKDWPCILVTFKSYVSLKFKLSS